jgi:RHS repeat-associated protein
MLRSAVDSCTRILRAPPRTTHIFALTLALLVLTLGRAEPAWATNVSGTISTNTTWTLANSPYVMTGNVTVASGVTLTIEAGVVVQGNSTSRQLSVSGSLSANGTSGQHITFTSTSDSAAGQWGGIRFNSGAGASTLAYADIRYGGGGGFSDTNGMVQASGGTITIEDSTFTSSYVSGLRVAGGTSGTNVSVTIRRSKFEGNGFQGTNLRGDGMNVNNARVVVEDSAFWSNANDGIDYTVASGYTPAPGEISGSSIWDNERYGVYLFQDTSVAALAPDGNVAGKPGNAIYDNGTFGFLSTERWHQLSILRTSLSVDWSGTYWGPVRYVPCAFGSQNGHLSYGAPDPDPNASFPVERGPVNHTLAVDGGGGGACGNDDLLVNPPAYELPDLYFDAPPPTFGGLTWEQLLACLDCLVDALQNAMAHDSAGGNAIEYTGQPVSTATGSLTEAATDLKLAGPGIAFEWTRSYSSRDATVGALGPGWTHPFAAQLTVIDSTTLEYRSGSGQRTRFTKVTGGGTGAATYRGKGFDGTLKRIADNSYEMKTRDQRTFLFDTSGKLTQIKPRFLPATTLTYTSGKLTSITDSAGRVITITYLGSDPNLIWKVELPSPDSRYVEYGYTSGRLSSVRDARGKTWTLAYDGNGRLQSIRDPLLRYEIQNVLYDGSGRVTSEQDGTGDTISYAYTTSGNYDVTTVTIPGRGDWIYRHRGNMLFEVEDPLGRKTSYTYDVMGRRASVKDGRGNVRRFEYDAYGNVVKEVAPAALGFSITRTFNGTNDLLTEKDGRGNMTTYVYASGSDPAADYQVGELKTITDRENGITTFKYWTTTSTPTPPATNVGLLKSVVNPRLQGTGKSEKYEYDASGNLTKITGPTPLELKTTMTYDWAGRLETKRDPRGNVPVPPAGYLTTWAYDAVDHVTSLTDARGNVTTYNYYDNEFPWKVTRTDRGSVARITMFEYDDDNRLWKTTQPNAATPEIRLYWADGQLKSVESPELHKTTYSYDDAGQLTSVVEPNGNAPGGTASDWTWTYGYDNAGNRTSEAHPDGGTREIAYDALNRPFEWTDALDHVTTVEYDANSNVTKRTNGLNKFKTYTYDKLDRLKTEKDERQLADAWVYDYYSTGELKCVTSPKGFVTNYGIDDDGRATSMVDPRAAVACGGTSAQYTWTYEYDEAGNRKKVTDPLGNHVDYLYDELNNVTQVTDERGNVTAFTYDVMNRLAKVTPPAAGGTGTLDTEYAYDPRGNLNSRTDPNAHVTTWVYDLDGLLTSRTTPVGTWNYTYFANGTPKTLETPAGSSTPGTPGDGTITYSYDRMSRLTGVDHSDTTPDVTRVYDLAGRLDTMTDGAGGTVDYSFDNADRLTNLARSGASAGLNGTLHYDYNDAGHITGRTYPDTTASTYAFDEDGRLTSFISGGQTTSFGYDEANNVTTVTLPSGNGHVATRTFDRAGRLTTVENKKGSTILSKFLWTLDAASNPYKVQTTRGVNDTYDAFEYDTRNRLTASCFGVSSGATDCVGAANKITYAYDKVSNRTQEVRTGSVGNTGTIDYSYNAADQLTSTTMSGQTTNYTYDTNGNQASAGARTFTYNLADQLVSTTNAGTTTAYAYDGDGRRVSSTVGGGADLRYVWDPLAESGIPELTLKRDSSGNLVRRYLNGPLGAVSMTNSSATFYYHHDPLGTVTDVTDASGTAQWRYEYEAYGAERSATNVSGSAPENRFRFSGQYLDSETAHYHMRTRQYDPATGRFDALDPLENAVEAPNESSYLYAGGQPLVLRDPLGLFGADRDSIDSYCAQLANEIGPYAGRACAAVNSFSGSASHASPSTGVCGASGYSAIAAIGGEGNASRACVGAAPLSAGTVIQAALTALLTRNLVGAPGRPPAIGPTGNPGAFPFRGFAGLANKASARQALAGLDCTSEQLAAANAAISRATTTSTISVGTYGPNVVVRIERPGVFGSQTFETVIRPDGTKTVLQRTYDEVGNLSHYDVKLP